MGGWWDTCLSLLKMVLAFVILRDVGEGENHVRRIFEDAVGFREN